MRSTGAEVQRCRGALQEHRWCIGADMMIEVQRRSCRDGGAVLSRCRGGLSEVIVQVQIAVRCKVSEEVVQ